MSPVIYFLAEHYPWWGIPSILIFGEAANHFRRNGKRGKLLLCGGFAMFFLALTVLFFWIGYENIRSSLQGFEGGVTH